jgi:putative hemolysin
MELISFEKLEQSGLNVPAHPILRKALSGYLKVPQMNKLFREKIGSSQGAEFIDKLFDAMDIKLDIDDSQRRNLPEKGPFIVISNHPFGFLDGLAMLKIIGAHNPNFKVLANYFLGEFDPVRNFFIPMNPFGNGQKMNVSGLKAAFSHLAAGSPLGIFPAGEVASMHRNFGKVEESEWDESIIKFICRAKVPIVPMYFNGQNSLPFHLLGRIHPYLRTLSIPGEFFNKEGASVSIRIGKPIYPADLGVLSSADKVGRFLRISLLSLGQQKSAERENRSPFQGRKRVKPIVAPVLVEKLKADLMRLKSDNHLLFSKSNYEVYYGDALQMPNVLREIGRLRETTFRQVGEGTNQSIDLDRFDTYYRHLFVFDNHSDKIVGAYRLGLGSEIMDSYGKDGFYVNTLFKMGQQLSPMLFQTIELGRSFVAEEYQQKPLPLFLLWQGILHVLKKNPAYRFLMGPVSISNDFSPFSRDLIIGFVKQNHYNHVLAQWVRPAHQAKRKSNVGDINIVLEQNNNDVQKLDKFISSIEPRALKVPVLLKQYIRQNAKIIGFNVDPQFNNSLDGLMLLDINDLPEETLKFLQSR